jgi:hypothetical protein
MEKRESAVFSIFGRTCGNTATPINILIILVNGFKQIAPCLASAQSAEFSPITAQ